MPVSSAPFVFRTGLKGAFSDSLDAILMADYNGDADGHRIHVLRHSDYYLNNVAKLNIFVMCVALATGRGEGCADCRRRSKQVVFKCPPGVFGVSVSRSGAHPNRKRSAYSVPNMAVCRIPSECSMLFRFPAFP